MLQSKGVTRVSWFSNNHALKKTWSSMSEHEDHRKTIIQSGTSLFFSLWWRSAAFANAFLSLCECGYFSSITSSKWEKVITRSKNCREKINLPVCVATAEMREEGELQLLTGSRVSSCSEWVSWEREQENTGLANVLGQSERNRCAAATRTGCKHQGWDPLLCCGNVAPDGQHHQSGMAHVTTLTH